MTMSKLRFQIEYHTKWGECLQVELQTSNGESGHIALTTKDGLQWCGDFIPAPNTTFIRLDYFNFILKIGLKKVRIQLA